MKIKTRSILLIITTLIVVWGIFEPTALRGAIANNLWSVKFIRETNLGLPISPQLTNHPNTHKHAGLLLAHQALKEDEVELAIDYLAPLTNSSDRLVNNTFAQIRFINGDYRAAIEIWKNIKDAGSLNFAGVGLAENGEIDLAILAYQYAYEIRPEKEIYRHRVVGYQAAKASTLMDSHQLEEAIKAYQQIIAQYPDRGKQ